MAPRVPKLWKPMQEENELAFSLRNAVQADVIGFDKDVLLFGSERIHSWKVRLIFGKYTTRRLVAG